MAKFKLTKKAIQDLSGIWEYTLEVWSEQQADKYYLMLIAACTDIAKSPARGKKYFEIYPGLLGQQISKHLVFYRIIDKSTIEITRILHERMDVKGQFGE